MFHIFYNVSKLWHCLIIFVLLSDHLEKFHFGFPAIYNKHLINKSNPTGQSYFQTLFKYKCKRMLQKI